MDIRKARLLRNGLILGGIGLMLGTYLWEPLLYVGWVVAFSGLIPHFLYNRCPHCGKQLGSNERDYCQHCGKRIS